MVIGTRVDPRTIVGQVCDPEIPFLSITDLGIVRSVEANGREVEVTVTPTYSGCPAMEVIKSEIEDSLKREGFGVVVKTVLDPPWTTDDITPRGRRLLERNGIAAPNEPQRVLCPRCTSSPPRMVSEFGSTACKALMVCGSCSEPFDLFKELR